VLVSTSRHAAAAARLAALTLPGRVQVGLVPEPVRRLPSGLPHLDALLGGGVPRGRISELLGPLSCGKTSLLLALLAAVTQRGEVVACVDLSDALHPESVAAAGVDLPHLLWVRPRGVTDALRCAEVLLQAGGFAAVALDLGEPLPRPLRPSVWPRLLRAAEQSHTALVVLAPQHVAGSCAGLSLGLRRRALHWRRGLWPLFEGLETTALLVRSKLGAPGRHVAIRAAAVDSRESRVESNDARTETDRPSTLACRRETESR
jgi:hypothetical protein